jgi:hypothetical protein
MNWDEWGVAYPPIIAVIAGIAGIGNPGFTAEDAEVAKEIRG